MGRTKSILVPQVSRLWVLVLALTVLAVPALRAQSTTGAVEGVVKDASGAVLPGATVEATGPAGIVRSVSDDQGEFRFPRLLPGRYKVMATLSGFSTRESDVTVTVDKTARVEFGLAVGGVAENVQVSASAVIDMSSPATATNITRERIELLPSGRDFTDVVAQAAGAANESQAGGISIDGSSGSENRFVIDGVDSTDPQEGINAVPLRKEFTEEIQVKSAGYAAEFGGSTGGVINVITKSGSNNFRGGALFEAQQRKWGGDERPLLRDSLTSNTFAYVDPPKDDETRLDPGVWLGGPILRDRLWFFGSYQPGLRNNDRTVNFSNGVTNTFNEDFKVQYRTFNVTGNAGSKLLFRGGGNFSPTRAKARCPDKDGRTSLTAHVGLDARRRVPARDLLRQRRLCADVELHHVRPPRTLRDGQREHGHHVPGPDPQLQHGQHAGRHRRHPRPVPPAVRLHVRHPRDGRDRRRTSTSATS